MCWRRYDLCEMAVASPIVLVGAAPTLETLYEQAPVILFDNYHVMPRAAGADAAFVHEPPAKAEMVLYDFEAKELSGDITPTGGTKLDLSTEHATSGKALGSSSLKRANTQVSECLPHWRTGPPMNSS